MKKIWITTVVCLLVILSGALLAYSETENDEKAETQDLSLAKAIQSELPGVFKPEAGFAASAGADFFSNTPSVLASAGVVSSSDITLNQNTPIQTPKVLKENAKCLTCEE